MTSRERVKAALEHRQPDRCPVDFWAVPELVERLAAHYGVAGEDELLDIFQVDMQFIFPTASSCPSRGSRTAHGSMKWASTAARCATVSACMRSMPPAPWLCRGGGGSAAV